MSRRPYTSASALRPRSCRRRPLPQAGPAGAAARTRAGWWPGRARPGSLRAAGLGSAPERSRGTPLARSHSGIPLRARSHDQVADAASRRVVLPLAAQPCAPGGGEVNDLRELAALVLAIFREVLEADACIGHALAGLSFAALIEFRNLPLNAPDTAEYLEGLGVFGHPGPPLRAGRVRANLTSLWPVGRASIKRCLNPWISPVGGHYVVRGSCVRLLAFRRVNVDDGVGKPSKMVQKLMASFLGDVVGLPDGQSAIDGDVE